MTTHAGWNTTIAMIPSRNPFGKRDSFNIVVNPFTHTFTGTYTDDAGTKYEWKGTSADAEAANVAAPADFAAVDQASATMLLAADVDAPDNTPFLGIQDLMNVSAIATVKDSKGNERVVDTAQVKTGKYFQDILINSLDKQWIEKFFGTSKHLPDNVQAVMKAHETFYKDKAVMSLGQLIHDNFGTVEANKKWVQQIDNDKLAKAWKDMGADKEYHAQANDLYIQGYRDGVPGMKAYLDDKTIGPKGWAKKLHDNIVSEDFLNIWAVQVSSAEFKNIKQQMYEWYTQLLVLDPDNVDQAKNMLTTTFAVILNSRFTDARWTEEMKPFLQQAIDNLLNGTLDFGDEMLQANAAQFKKLMAQMISTVDSGIELANQLATVFTIVANQKPETPAAQLAGDAVDLIEKEAAKDPKKWNWWGKLKDKVPGPWKTFASDVVKLFGSLAYAAGAGFIIYMMVDDKNLNPAQQLNLGLLATGFFVKSIEKFMATKVGTWIGRNMARLGRFAGNLGKWFTKEGVVAQGLIATWAVRVFGKNSAEFFAKRLGPALAVVGIVVTGIDLYKAIQSGNTRDIVFESFNLFFALAGLVFIGLQMWSFAWAGPIGAVFALVGAVVILVQIIWNLVDPPAPPPGPVEQFVNGPLKDKKFTKDV